jgi:hypothetical protein
MMKKFFLLFIGIIIVAMLLNMLLSENINTIEGGFEELAFVRNENNTGPVHRLYAYHVSDTLWGNIQKHADLLPHTKYGSTEVYYFIAPAKAEAIQLNLNDSKQSNFEREYCIAYLKKNGMGKLSFERFPF